MIEEHEITSQFPADSQQHDHSALLTNLLSEEFLESLEEQRARELKAISEGVRRRGLVRLLGKVAK